MAPNSRIGIVSRDPVTSRPIPVLRVLDCRHQACRLFPHAFACRPYPILAQARSRFDLVRGQPRRGMDELRFTSLHVNPQAALISTFFPVAALAIAAVRRSMPFRYSAFALSGSIFSGKWMDRKILPASNSHTCTVPVSAMCS